MALGWLGLAALFAFVLMWAWPAAALVGWAFAWALTQTIGLAFAAVVAAWLVLLPPLLWLALEHLARHAMRAAGGTPMDLPLWRGLVASLHVTLRTLPMRLGWAGAGLLCSLIGGPLGALVSAIGMGQIACLDALDLALALRGLDGGARMRALSHLRHERFAAGSLAGLLNLGCAASIVLWPLWLPGLVVGAAQRVTASECRNENDE
jgi:hypothetical protein